MTRQHMILGGWSTALVVAIAFTALGHWQWQRMRQKQQLLEQVAQVGAHPQALEQALARPPGVYWVDGRGRFLPERILLDNQMHAGRAGLRVYQPLIPEGGGREVLVDLGWVPVPPDRQLPTVASVLGEHRVRGLLMAPPSAGIALGPALAATAQPGAWLATRIEPEAIARTLGRRDISSQVLRLDPVLPLGYARDLEVLPNTLPPARHLGYAVQWFGLALAVLVTAAILHWRAWRRPGGR